MFVNLKHSLHMLLFVFKLSVPPIWIYIPSFAQLSPPSFGIFKVYVDIENLFLFQFCFRDLFVKNEGAPCYARPIHGKGALALGQFQLVRSFHIL